MAMTVSEMKRDAVNLIYQVDDKNTEKMEKILLFLKASVSEINNDTMYDRQRKERVAKVKNMQAFSLLAKTMITKQLRNSICLININDYESIY